MEIVYNMVAYKLKVMNIEDNRKSTLKYITEMPIIGKKKTVAIIPVRFF